MAPILIALALTATMVAQSFPGAKQMFYDPGVPFYHCGIHYWLETEGGVKVTTEQARVMPGSFTIHLRNNIGGGFLTVWELSEGRELTPKDDRWSGGGRWSGIVMSDAVYTVPGTFEFRADAPKHVVIVWARSQSEVAHSATRARERLIDMPAWMPIVSETESVTPGEIGTYVVNRLDAGVSTEIVFQSR
jgi:hypothetical protein